MKPPKPKQEKKFEKLPTIPDESKWDIVYVLPFFAKPGKHTYMIKYKNSLDPNQKLLLEKEQQLKHKLGSTIQTNVDRTNTEIELQDVL